MAEYDSLAERYSSSQEGKTDRKYVMSHSFMKTLGKTTGLDVLDLACGSGYFTRRIKLSGARHVVGVDVSRAMIGLARKEEGARPLGIEYVVGDVLSLGRIGEFDRVSASFLLSISGTREALLRMCRSAFVNLRKGGAFVTLTLNPESPLASDKKYGTIVTCDELKEGAKLTTRLFSGGREYCSLVEYHWSKAAYEGALRKAGFVSVEWVPAEVSNEGLRRFGKGFWEGFLKSPYLAIIKARKQK
jgi:ubiquinone/menaquinone biosynthesis C-methylase UbiE